jgi:hypothetical protein
MDKNYPNPNEAAMKKITPFLLFILFSCSASAQADIYVKSKMMDGMGSNETWTSGKKQRMVTQAAGIGSVVGDIINIVRADKGVEWQLNTKMKIYEEKQIALPYSKEGELTKEEQAELEKYKKEHPQEAESAEAPACTTVDKSGPKIFAGITAYGYSSGCPSEGPKMTLWIADGNQAQAKQAFKEMEDFQAARAEAMYANYPPAQKKQLMETMKLIGTAMAGGLMGMPDPAKLPQSMAMGMETSAPGEGPHMMMEVVAVDNVAADPSRYELPEGYTKVDNVMAAQAQTMMDQMASGEGKFSDILNGFQKMGEEMGIPDDGTPAPTQQEMQQIDEGAKDIAQFVKGQQQLQGAAQTANAVFPTNAPTEAWQQGLYDQPAQAVQQAAIQEQNMQQQQVVPAPQGLTQSPAQRKQAQQGNSTAQTLHEVNALIQNMQGLASSFSGGGMGMGNIQEMMNAQGGEESYSESSDYESSEESYEEAPQEEESSEEEYAE